MRTWAHLSARIIFSMRVTSFLPLPKKQNRPASLPKEVAGCATGSVRPLSAHLWGELLSLYFGLFLYQVQIVATVVGVSRSTVLHSSHTR